MNKNLGWISPSEYLNMYVPAGLSGVMQMCEEIQSGALKLLMRLVSIDTHLECLEWIWGPIV